MIVPTGSALRRPAPWARSAPRARRSLLGAGSGEHVLGHDRGDHRNDQRSDEQRDFLHVHGDRLP
jgi:hypothetical protein